MHAVEMLTAQHREMEKAFKEVLDLCERDEALARKRFMAAADVLMSHVIVEETVFYPAVNARRTEDVLLESLEEHLSLKRLVADLLHLAPDDAQFKPKVHVLKEQSEHHHEEEEEKLFPKVEKLLSREELDSLGEEMGRAQAQLLAENPRLAAPAQTDAAASLT